MYKTFDEHIYVPLIYLVHFYFKVKFGAVIMVTLESKRLKVNKVLLYYITKNLTLTVFEMMYDLYGTKKKFSYSLI